MSSSLPARRKVIMVWSSFVAVLRCFHTVVGIVYYYQKASMAYYSSQNLKGMAGLPQ
jgi:hypothetical protein